MEEDAAIIITVKRRKNDVENKTTIMHSAVGYCARSVLVNKARLALGIPQIILEHQIRH